MDRVGGYESLLLLEEDARAYDEILVIMLAENEAEKEKERRRKKK